MAAPSTPKPKPKAPPVRVLCRNKKALHDYQIDETIEAGIALLGSEVKSLRDARASLADAYAVVRGGEMYLVGAQISEYPWANQFNHAPHRERKLLLHRAEIRRLASRIQDKGYSLVALEIYSKGGTIKVQLGLGRGRREYDKRAASRARDERREVEAALKDRGR